jgi:hypothetical protein
MKELTINIICLFVGCIANMAYNVRTDKEVYDKAKTKAWGYFLGQADAKRGLWTIKVHTDGNKSDVGYMVCYSDTLKPKEFMFFTCDFPNLKP